MAKALVLRAITGSHAGKRHTLTGRVSTVGSSASNDVVLHDRLVNPRHIEIRQVLERWFVVPEVAGSNPVIHPSNIKASNIVGSFFNL